MKWSAGFVEVNHDGDLSWEGEVSFTHWRQETFSSSSNIISRFAIETGSRGDGALFPISSPEVESKLKAAKVGREKKWANIKKICSVLFLGSGRGLP